MPPTPRLVLASASPRRAELLRVAGFEFEIVPPAVDEQPRPREQPRALVQRLAAAKSAAVAQRRTESVVLGADTAVVVDNAILGKPVDEADATRMLQLLSGRTHDVLTAISLRTGARHLMSLESTRVRFVPLDAQEIAWYVASGEPSDKAGAYAIQGLASRFVDSFEGSYGTVVGLPVAAVYRLLGELRVDAGA